MPKDLRVIYPSVACYKTSRVSSLSGSAVNSPQFRTSFTLPLRSLAKVDWKTNKNHLPVEFKGSLIYQVLGWPNNGNVWQVWGISPQKNGALFGFPVGVMKFHDFSEVSMKVSRFHESYPPLNLTANAPKMDKKTKRKVSSPNHQFAGANSSFQGGDSLPVICSKLTRHIVGPGGACFARRWDSWHFFPIQTPVAWHMVNEHSWLEYLHFQ